MKPISSPISNRRGYSLLELVLSVALVAGTLVPALALLRDGLEFSRETDDRLLLSNYAVQKLEERLAIVATGWPRVAVEPDPGQSSQGSNSGDLAADGFPFLRYTVTWSDLTIDGGLPDALMHVTSTTYIDEDGDDTFDANEPSCTFRTKIAQLATYNREATSE